MPTIQWYTTSLTVKHTDTIILRQYFFLFWPDINTFYRGFISYIVIFLIRVLGMLTTYLTPYNAPSYFKCVRNKQLKLFKYSGFINLN